MVSDSQHSSRSSSTPGASETIQSEAESYNILLGSSTKPNLDNFKFNEDICSQTPSVQRSESRVYQVKHKKGDMVDLSDSDTDDE